MLYQLPAVEGTLEKALNRDGTQLIALSETGLKVWDVASSSVVRQIKPPRGSWSEAALSPGAGWLATKDDSGLVRVTNVATGREVGRAGNREAEELAVSSDGSLLAVIRANAVHVWRVRGWRRVATLPHEWQVAEMKFSWDGRRITTVTPKVSMDADEITSTSFPGSAIRVWDLKTGGLVMHVSLAQEGGFYDGSIAFSANGNRLVTHSNITVPASDGLGGIDTEGFKLVAWTLLPEDLIDTACSLLTRNLSCSEWSTFMSSEPYRRTCKTLPGPEVECRPVW